MFVILFSIGYAEMITLRRIIRIFNPINCFFFLQKEIKALSLLDWLFLLRHLLISIYSWILTPILLQRVDEKIATIILFVVTIFTTFIFLKITKWKTEKSILFKVINFFCRNKKLPTAIILPILEPYLGTVFYKDNYHPNKKPGKKVWLLLLTSSILATMIWTVIVYFSGLRF